MTDVFSARARDGAPAPAGLTFHQKQALDFIQSFIAEHGWSPSMDEIAWGLGLKSKSGAHRVVDHLRLRGYITIMPGHARSIAIVRSRP